MRKSKRGLSADEALYAAADRALRALREDLLHRAALADDYEMVVQFGEMLVRYGSRSIARVSGYPKAAEATYRIADDLVATAAKEVAL